MCSGNQYRVLYHKTILSLFFNLLQKGGASMALIPRSLIIFWIFFGVLCLLPISAIGLKYSCSKKTKDQEKMGGNSHLSGL